MKHFNKIISLVSHVFQRYQQLFIGIKTSNCSKLTKKKYQSVVMKHNFVKLSCIIASYLFSKAFRKYSILPQIDYMLLTLYPTGEDFLLWLYSKDLLHVLFGLAATFFLWGFEGVSPSGRRLLLFISSSELTKIISLNICKRSRKELQKALENIFTNLFKSTYSSC